MTSLAFPRAPVAHTPNAAGHWDDLGGHLTRVSARARSFGERLGTGEWAALAGLWHDLGKYHPDFQQMLRDVVSGRPKRRVDHSTLGAVHAMAIVGSAFQANANLRQVEFLSLLLTATVAGHHAGLPEGRDALVERLERQSDRYRELLNEAIPQEVLNPPFHLPPLPPQLRGRRDRDVATELLVRFVLSMVVDADRLDAEAFASEGCTEEEQPAVLRRYTGIEQLRGTLDAHIDNKVENAELDRMGPVELAVHDYRQSILAACRRAALEPPGAFALDVATGGGKTLASLSFALRHAEAHRKNRIIVVIPFTSIIEQTSAEYRRAFGALGWNVLEHHSAVADEPLADPDWGSPARHALRVRLATANWDARIVVTTAVQFFESLHSARPSRCRKLHNVANSVVIIDEAQMLPPGLLTPTVWVMNELVERYGTTLVLSTATQPALEPPFPEVRNLRRIVPASTLRPPARVRVEVVDTPATGWDQLAGELAALPQVLCITHQRRDARELIAYVDRVTRNEDTIHLSAALCAAHRSIVVDDIRRRLGEGLGCRVISTQLVEAGVDLDFPVVYRALGGIDAMVQAAGRANREGRLGLEGGLLRIYRPPTKPPVGLPRSAADAAGGLIAVSRQDNEPIKLFDPDLARAYFRRFYRTVADMDRGITNLRRAFRFRSVEKEYYFIGDAGLSVVVPYDDGMDIVRAIRVWGIHTNLLRRLQRYSVSVFPHQLASLSRLGAVSPLMPGDERNEVLTFVLNETHSSFYHTRFGLLPGGAEAPASGAFIT